MHNVSPMKESKKNNHYFDMTLQLKDKNIRGICFSPESASPVKITNCRIKRNAFTQEDEVHISKRSKIMDPRPKELDFDIGSVKEESEHTNEQPISIIQRDLPKCKFNVTGHVTICGPAVTVNSNGKLLEKQDAVITDESGSIKVVFWQGDHKKIASGETHKLTNIIVKSFQNAPYLTLTRDSTIEACKTTIEREDDNSFKKNTKKFAFPPHVVKRINRYEVNISVDR